MNIEIGFIESLKWLGGEWAFVCEPFRDQNKATARTPPDGMENLKNWELVGHCFNFVSFFIFYPK